MLIFEEENLIETILSNEIKRDGKIIEQNKI